MNLLLEQIFNGITLGAFYALVTLGLVLTFSVLKIVNFSHGDLFMVSGYTLYLLMKHTQLHYLIIVVLVILLTALYSIIIERLVIHPILNRPWWAHAVATLGLAIVMQNAITWIFTTDPRQVPTIFSSQVLEVAGIRASYQRWLVVLVTILVFVGLQWFVKKTKLGKTMRAVSQSAEVCKLVGIDTKKIALITFLIGGAITGLAAALVAPLFNVYPQMGSMITLKALAAIIMGGMGSVNGAMYAGMLLGMVESLFGGYVSLAYKDVAAFTFFILVLLFRPHGLFGKKIGL
ncbi:MAG TPA: branched-chain amino acid ABC transporter permease [Bellilinea sp.]|nr:branched-chain amino acid ABC transporter permease [Bellilinea sp.]